MIGANSYFKGERGDQGNVAAYIEALGHMIAENDGKHDFWAITEDCSDNQAPFLENQETTVHLTAGDNHDVVQIEDGFITFEIEIVVKMDGIGTYVNDARMNKVFIGYKNSAEILHQLQVFNRGQNCGLQDNECLREGFAMHTISPKISKQKKFDHSLWENVERMSPCVAGRYVDMAEFTGGKSVTINFEVNLPVTDIMCMQAFTLYPVCCLGPLDLKFYVKRDGLVWAQIDPLQVLEQQLYFGDLSPTDSLIAIGEHLSTDVKVHTSRIKHGFTQIGNAAHVVTAQAEGQQLTMGNATLFCQSMKIIRCNSTIFGFRVKDSTKNRIANFFSQTRYLPSQ
jgi:hypothetical protein